MSARPRAGRRGRPGYARRSASPALLHVLLCAGDAAAAPGPAAGGAPSARERPAHTVKLLGTGFGRTGTSSLARALVDMGFAKGPDIYNMRTVLSNMKGNIGMWRRIAKTHAAGRPVTGLFHQLFRGHIAVTDYPAVAWWEEIQAAFPEAKVIHTWREPEAWYASSMNTTFPFVQFAQTNSLVRFLELEQQAVGKSRASWPDRGAGKPAPEGVRGYGVMMQEAVWDRLFGRGADPSRPELRRRVVDAYAAQTERVRARHRGSPRFLELKVGEQNFTRLCEFLEWPRERCPAVAFPRSNERNDFYRSSILPVLNGRLVPPTRQLGPRRQLGEL